MSKCCETLLAWISFAISVIYPPTTLSFYLKSEKAAMQRVCSLARAGAGGSGGDVVDYLEVCSFC